MRRRRRGGRRRRGAEREAECVARAGVRLGAGREVRPARRALLDVREDLHETDHFALCAHAQQRSRTHAGHQLHETRDATITY